MTIKKAIGKLHLWLGFTSGLLVFVIAVTGCIYAFQEEIQNVSQPYRFVKEQHKAFLPPSEIMEIAQKKLPGKQIHAVMYQGKTKTAKAIFYGNDGNEDYYYFVYINQYSGKVLQVSNENAGFFRFILDGHYYLWLPPEIGSPIVASATLVFFVMVISGIILWWPRNKAGRKQRFKLKWNARWRRKNYDLHNVLGFYASWLGLIFAITGLVWGFQWFNATYYTVISGGKDFVEYEEPLSKVQLTDTSGLAPMDKLWTKLMRECPIEGSIEVHQPEDSTSCLAVNINPDPTTYWKIDYRYFDQYSLEELSVKHLWGRYKNTSASDKLMRMNYDIHVGSVLGLTGKILAFCASLIIASLPITGFLIWWGRRNKPKKEPVKKQF
ncbi:MAG: peptidase M4 [Candidatus Fluviicola riflensis]|nr:MAG: peptidase M4 [Candidatus Fluviicola riflensis]OGS76439.1 MAG: peptidase M4 [Candidatus Fluviicola riflensis]OGS82733.1 MAG: peptidase M4 [Fluviicola sp. RIFCSPHIGHO2_01_FULL_43_53]OGS89032.1 MAG: peptidase M4 [Fluviicola sp. RIFCSPHIGHO2_12_FULL_43_24]